MDKTKAKPKTQQMDSLIQLSQDTLPDLQSNQFSGRFSCQISQIEQPKFLTTPVVKKTLIDRNTSLLDRAVQALQLLPSKTVKILDKKTGAFDIKLLLTNKVVEPLANLNLDTYSSIMVFLQDLIDEWIIKPKAGVKTTEAPEPLAAAS